MAIDEGRPITSEARKRTYIDHLCKLVNDALNSEIDASIKDRAVTCNGERASILIRMLSGEECTLSITDKDQHKELLRKLTNREREIMLLQARINDLEQDNKALVNQLMGPEDDK